MNMQEAIALLTELYNDITECHGWDNAGEQSECRMMLDGLVPEHRQAIIEYRDDALECPDWKWVTILSHIVYAMSEPRFYLGETVALSVN